MENRYLTCYLRVNKSEEDTVHNFCTINHISYYGIAEMPSKGHEGTVLYIMSMYEELLVKFKLSINTYGCVTALQ